MSADTVLGFLDGAENALSQKIEHYRAMKNQEKATDWVRDEVKE